MSTASRKRRPPALPRAAKVQARSENKSSAAVSGTSALGIGTELYWESDGDGGMPVDPLARSFRRAFFENGFGLSSAGAALNEGSDCRIGVADAAVRDF